MRFSYGSSFVPFQMVVEQLQTKLMAEAGKLLFFLIRSASEPP